MGSRPLVGSSSTSDLRAMHERLDDPDLLSIAPRQFSDRPIEHDVEPFDQRLTPCLRRSIRGVVRASRAAPGPSVGQRGGDLQAHTQRDASSPRCRCGNRGRGSTPCRPSGGSRSSRSLIVVLLPAPFGPRKAKTSPRSTRRSSPANARTPPAYVFASAAVSIAGADGIDSIVVGSDRQMPAPTRREFVVKTASTCTNGTPKRARAYGAILTAPPADHGRERLR